MTAFTLIPVVDVSGLLGDDADARVAVAAELGRAAREVGFLYVTGTGLDPALYDGLLAATQQFFALPLAAKMAVYIGRSDNHRGYVPVGEEGVSETPDHKEAYDLSLDLPADHPAVAGARMLGPNQWPDLPGFADAVQPYYDAVLALGRTLLRGFALALGEDAELFDGFVTTPPSQLRLIHYPYGEPGAEDKPGIGAHTDYEAFTLLRSTAPGLEVMNGAGEWIDAPPMPDAFVVNIGDLLELWTNGAFIATSHRVRPVTQERWSFPLFFNVDHDTWVEPLPQFLAPGEQPRPGLRAGEHLFAQTAQTFAYLRSRLESGDLVLPEGSLAVASFGQSHRKAEAHRQEGRG